MLEGWAAHALAQAGRHDVTVDSAGTGDWHAGQPPDPRAIATARRHGIDIAGQRARVLRPADFDDFDWLLAADDSVLATLRARGPSARHGRLALVLPWAGVATPREVPDPYYGDDAGFEHVASLSAAVARGVLARLPRRA